MTALQKSALSPDELVLRLEQQELVAAFGVFALAQPALQDVFDEACRVAANGLRIRFAKVLRYRPVSNDLLVTAGVGWNAGVVGHRTIGAGLDSPAGYALHTGEPTLANALQQEQRFRIPSLLAEHGIQSAINVLIRGEDADPFGVLEVDSTHRHEFVSADTAFLQSLGHLLAAAIARTAADQVKDDLLRDKDLLMQEIHHRVKNSLQLVRTLLNLQARTASPETQQHLQTAAARIMTIGAVHQRLYEGASVLQTDAAAYLRALLHDMAAMLADAAAGRPIVVEAEPMLLPADQVTPLGLVATELVTNAMKYGAGRVLVGLRRAAAGIELTVADEGPGFPPDFDPAAPHGLGMRLVAAMAKGDPAAAVVVDRSVPHGRVVVTFAP